MWAAQSGISFRWLKQNFVVLFDPQDPDQGCFRDVSDEQKLLQYQHGNADGKVQHCWCRVVRTSQQDDTVTLEKGKATLCQEKDQASVCQDTAQHSRRLVGEPGRRRSGP